MEIVIKTIPHDGQDYETVGNWGRDSDGNLTVSVSAMGNEDYEFLVGIHELVEAWLCERRGVSDAAVTAFDTAYEAARPAGDLSEPGDDPAAPYSQEHCLATAVERMLCPFLGIRWADYEKACQGLSP